MGPKRALTYPCGQCGKGCGNNSIQCSSCQKWIHRRCVPMSPELLAEWSSDNLNFLCPTCAFTDKNYDLQAALNR